MANQKAKPQNKAKSAEDSGGFSRIFGDVANKTSQAAGRASAFMIAAAVVLIWAVTGPLFQYSDTWQLVARRPGPERAEQGRDTRASVYYVSQGTSVKALRLGPTGRWK